MSDLDLVALADALRTDWHAQARPEQLPPPGDWFGWLILAGRGWGKTRTGAQWILEQKRGGCRMMGLIGATAADVRDVMIQGPAGILRCAPEYDRPDYQPSNRCLIWRNGAQALLFSAEEPDRLRGPQFEAVWLDELAAYGEPVSVWEQLEYGLRSGNPRAVITTTPRPLAIIKELKARADFVVTTGSTYDNRENLAASIFDNVIAKNEATRLGRQEIHAEILEDTPGALWTLDMIERARVKTAPALTRIIVAVDPAVTSGASSDLTGIVAVGLGEDGHTYVLKDISGRYSPLAWASKVVGLYWSLRADRVIAETNMGGDMIEASLRNVDPNVSFKGIPARLGKIGRAEPVAACYEQSRVHHVGVFPELEAEMCGYTPGSKKSPDRMDALVHGIAELMLGVSTSGVIEYYRQLAADPATFAPAEPRFGYAFTPPGLGRVVRFVVPEGHSTVMLMSGASLSPDAEGIIACPESDAGALRVQGWREAPPIIIEGEIVP